MSYFVFIGLLYSFLFGAVYFRASLQQKEIKTALDIGFIVMIAGFLGARLTHVIFESPEIYQEDWLRIFQFWYGGFVFYGGAIAAFAAVVIYLRKQQESLAEWTDFYAPICALGYGLGRISCFIAGCCFGRACALPWAVDGKHPAQLYAVAWELSVFVILLLAEKVKKLRPGSLFLSWLVFHSVGRMIMEYFRDDFRGPQVFGLSLSTFISYVLFTLALGLLVLRQKIADKS